MRNERSYSLEEVGGNRQLGQPFFVSSVSVVPAQPDLHGFGTVLDFLWCGFQGEAIRSPPIGGGGGGGG